MRDKINIPPMEEVVKHNPTTPEEGHDKDDEENNEVNNSDNESVEENVGREEDRFGAVPNIPIPPPIPMGNGIEENEEDDEEQKSRRGRPKTIHAKTACAKSMLIILNKLKKIHNKSLQNEVKELAEDAILELNYLHEIINKIL